MCGSGDSELAALEKRQENILTQLRNLKTEVDQLVKQQRGGADSDSKLWDMEAKPCKPFVKNISVEDIVISANPQCPPLSLLVLHSLLCRQYKVFSTCFVHSSATSTPEKFRKILGHNNNVERTQADLAFSIIWKKDQTCPSLSTRGVTLEGEAVIARYLSRLLKSSYESKNSVAGATEVDYFLDAASSMLSGSDNERTNVMLSINSKLSTSPSSWLSGNDMSLADIVTWSAINQCKLQSKAPAAVTSWLNNCSKSDAFTTAKSLL